MQIVSMTVVDSEGVSHTWEGAGFVHVSNVNEIKKPIQHAVRGELVIAEASVAGG